MDFTFFLGVDVSKNELDFSLRCGKDSLFHKEIPNTPIAIKQFFKELKTVQDFKLDQTLICLEHTGIYSNHLLAFLVKVKANIWMEAAIKIKRSMGLVRGKSDKIDAARIAQYAWEKREHAVLWKPKREVVQKLAYLTTIRRGLVEAQKKFKTQFSESKAFMDKRKIAEGQRLCELTMNSMKADLAKIEKAIYLVSANRPAARPPSPPWPDLPAHLVGQCGGNQECLVVLTPGRCLTTVIGGCGRRPGDRPNKAGPRPMGSVPIGQPHCRLLLRGLTCLRPYLRPKLKTGAGRMNPPPRSQSWTRT